MFKTCSKNKTDNQKYQIDLPLIQKKTIQNIAFIKRISTLYVTEKNYIKSNTVLVKKQIKEWEFLGTPLLKFFHCAPDDQEHLFLGPP